MRTFDFPPKDESQYAGFIKVALAIFLVFTAATLYGQQSAGEGYLLKENIQYRDGELTPYMKERCMLDLYYPEKEKEFATIIWFHGGGLKRGNKFIPETLKEQGIAVVAVNYRFSPKVSSPAYVEDAAAATAWVFKNIEQYGGDAGKIFVSGHSAGGYLASMIGLDKKYLAEYDIDANQIAGLIPFSGHAITHFTIRSERGLKATDVIVDDMAPIQHIRKDASPYVIVTGDREMELFGRYEESAYMYRMMKLVGHEETLLYELDGFNHGNMAEPAQYILLDYVKKKSKELAVQ